LILETAGAMRYTLRYDDGILDLDLGPRGAVKVAGDVFPPPLDDPRHALFEALEKPLGSRPLGALIPRTGTVSILLGDLTRGALTGGVLTRLLAYLEERGAGPDRVRLMLALGMHRPHTRAELAAHLGREIVERWPVLEHDPRSDAALVEAGTTPAGTHCFFNRGVVESALVIALGSVSFHYFAGYGGGRKLLLPGVAGESTILANHRLSLGRDPGDGLAGGCRPGNLDGNPVHEDMLAGARLIAAGVFAVNLVGDDRGALLFVSAGELDRSHRSACGYVSTNFRVPLERPYRAVIVSAGGFPKDLNLLQSHKALRQASYALDEGGLMLAAAACREGVGSDSYLGAFRGGRQRVPDIVRSRYTLNSQAAMSTFELTSRLSIYLKSMLPDDLVSRFGLCCWHDSFTGYLLEGIPDEDILIIANAGHFLPERVRT
jgi:nickel-dependent lactate racemase